MIKVYVAVIGGARCSPEEEKLAQEVGQELAKRGVVTVCGGGGGVMEAVSRGARSAGGITLGILPGSERCAGNEHLSYAIATGLGEARNAVIARTADALIAIGGEYGTLSEIALGLKMGKPVATLKSWTLVPPPQAAAAGLPPAALTAVEAVRQVLDRLPGTEA